MDSAVPLTPEQARKARTAFALLDRGDAQRALALATELAAAAAASPDSQHLLALCLARCGHADEAEQAFGRALALAPNHAMLARNYATFLRRAGRHAEAAAWFRRAAHAQPQDPRHWVDAGLAALDAGQMRQARALLSEALGRLPQSALVWQALGCAAREDGDDLEAERAFARCVALEPKHAPHWFNLGIARRRIGRPAEALACFAQAASLGLGGPPLRDAEIGALLDAGQVEDAIAAARAAVRTWPDAVALHETLVHLLWEYTDDDPFAELAAAAAAAPAQAALRQAHAQLLVQANRADDALRLIATLPQRDTLPCALLEAEALAMLDRDAAARALLERLWQAGQRVPAQLNLHARLCLKCRDPERALGLLDALLARHPHDQEALAYQATAWRLVGDPREFWLCDYDNLVTLRPIDGAVGGLAHDWLGTLAALLDRLHRARRQPIRQSLRHGSQTPGRLFGRDDPLLRAVGAALQAECERWLAGLARDPTHPFRARLSARARYVGSWSVRLRASGYHANHIHGEGWLSSAFYVQLPPSMRADRDEGCLCLGEPPVELGLGLPPRRVIRPQAGHLALFPSYCWHGTVPFDDPVPRITIAFDMLPASAAS